MKAVNVLVLLSAILNAHSHPLDTASNPIEDAANDLTNAIGNFFDVKADGIIHVVEEEVAGVQHNITQHSQQLHDIQQEIDHLALTGTTYDCSGKMHGGNCYYLVNQRHSNARAAASCANDGAELATLDSQDTMDDIHSYIAHSSAIADKSTIFVWTDMKVNDTTEVIGNNWLPGYPSSSTAEKQNIIWQVISDDMLISHDGVLNANPEALAYPLCKKHVITGVTCDAPTISNATNDCTASALLGSTCDVTCNAGYLMNGSATITCGDDNNDGTGDYANQPTCETITCAEPTISDATTDCTGSTDFNGTCTVTCNAGYYMSGSSTIICGDSDNDGIGDFASQPKCEITTCASPSDVTGSTFSCTGDVNYGGTCDLTCDSGYEGARTLTCDQHTVGDATSTWDDDSACTKSCDGLKYDGKCIKLVTTRYVVTYSGAEEECQKIGGGAQLAEIRTLDTLLAVYGYIRPLVEGSEAKMWVAGRYDIASHPATAVNWSDGTSSTLEECDQGHTPTCVWHRRYPKSLSDHTHIMLIVRNNPGGNQEGIYNERPSDERYHSLCQY